MNATRTIKVPDTLSRECTIHPAAGDERAMRVSISSEEPYLRYDWERGSYYWEVLDHTKIHTQRLDAGLSMLWNHDTDQHLGRATSHTCEGKKCEVGGIIWAAGEFAQNKKADVESGALKFTSVGYRVDEEGEVVDEKDGYPVIRFGFTPHEFSFVPVPADITVGYGRSLKPGEKPEEPAQFRSVILKDEKNMLAQNHEKGNNAATRKTMLKSPGQKFHEEQDDNKGGGIAVEVVEERERTAMESGRKAERERVSKIEEMAKNFNSEANLRKPLVELKAEALRDGKTPDEFQKMLLDNWTQAQRVEGADTDPNIGMPDADIRDFSFSKFYLEAASKKGLTGLEKEACEIAAQKYARDGRQFAGHVVPHDILSADFAKVNGLGKRGRENLMERIMQAERVLGRSQNATSFSAGGFLVGVNLLAGSFIDLLRNATLIGQGPFGIIELNGLVGNIAIPKQTSTVTTYWLAEGAEVTEANFAGGQLVFSPKRLVTRNSFTRQLLAQSTPSIEMLVRNDMALAQAVEEDRVVIQGTGLNGEPTGVVNTSGVGANVTFSGNWTWAKTLLFESSLENANVRTGEMVFLTTPTIKGRAKATPVVAASTFPIFIWMGSKGEFPTINGVKGGIVNEYGAYATKNSPTSGVVIFGVWNNNVTKARWAGMDIIVDPFSSSGSELVNVTQTQWMDVGVRYPQAFEVSTDAPTAP